MLLQCLGVMQLASVLSTVTAQKMVRIGKWQTGSLQSPQKVEAFLAVELMLRDQVRSVDVPRTLVKCSLWWTKFVIGCV